MNSMFSLKRFANRVAIILICSSLIALAVNALRPTPLDWVAKTIYEIYQDCPESTVSADVIELESIIRNRSSYLIVDTRDEKDRSDFPVNNSIFVEYDALFPVEKDHINLIVQMSAGKSVLVIGKGSIAKLMADELVSNGLKNIYYLSNPPDYKRLTQKEGE